MIPIFISILTFIFAYALNMLVKKFYELTCLLPVSVNVSLLKWIIYQLRHEYFVCDVNVLPCIFGHSSMKPKKGCCRDLRAPAVPIRIISSACLVCTVDIVKERKVLLTGIWHSVCIHIRISFWPHWWNERSTFTNTERMLIIIMSTIHAQPKTPTPLSETCTLCTLSFYTVNAWCKQ